MDWRVAGNEGQQSLESLLARRDGSQRLLMQLAQEEHRRDESQRNFKLNEEVRKGALARQVKQDATAAEDRDENRKLAKIGRTQATAKLLAPGSKITSPQEVADMRDAGLGSRLKEIVAQSALPDGQQGPVDNRDFVEGQHEFLGTNDQLGAQEKQRLAEEKAQEQQRMNELRNEVATGRLTVAQAQATLAREKLEFERTKPFAPQIMPGANGDVAVQFSRDGSSRNVDLPGGAHKTKTPAEIEANAAAASRGRAAGTPPKRNILSGITDMFTPKPAGSAPLPATSGASGGVVRMTAPDGRALNVPAAEVARLEAAGAKRVQ
jgi:hypothetical protein